MNTEHLRGKRVLLTGGTGFVGSRVVPLLVSAGAQVSILCRDSSRTDGLPDGVTVIRSDLLSGRGVEEALGQCDIFIHMAALLFGLGWQDYLSANCGAAQTLARALTSLGDRGPSRVVLISSLAGAGPCGSAPGRDEDRPQEPVSAYGWSKMVTENVLKAALGDRLVILRPPIIYGSGDLGMLPVYRGLARGVSAVPGLGRDFTVSVIHVDDVAQAVALACLEKASGVYHLDDGHPLPMADFYRAAAKALGRRAAVFHLPLWFMGLTAWLCTAAASAAAPFRRPGSRAPNWNMDKYREARQEGWVGTNRRISAELGFAPSRSLEDGMKETIEGNRRLKLL
ncbi:MAG: NAD(P)-dependent oxidoreductase [Desulfovibrionaceae bacterium]|nr:NAD(P)-dependent oxidoreductase [Desulfovibrionaceae bacterium]